MKYGLLGRGPTYSRGSPCTLHEVTMEMGVAPGQRYMQCYAQAMKIFLKAVVTGFGLSLGSALFKKVQRHLGLDDDNGKTPGAIKQDGATDPSLQQRFS
jgi:ribosomal protein S5